VLSSLALHGLRLLARRPRRGVLNALSIAVTVTGIVAILASHTFNARGHAGLDNLKIDRLNELAVIITVMLVILAAANTTFITWATVVDARQSSALAHAFGATPRQVSAGLSAAQLLPALPSTIVGIPAGIYLYRAVTHDQLTVPRPWQLLAGGDPARRHRAHCHQSLGARSPQPRSCNPSDHRSG